MKAEKLVFLLGDSIIDNGEYVHSGEPDVARQLAILLPHHTVVKRAVDGATSAGVLASQVGEVERADHIILSAGGNDALEHIDLLEEVIDTRARDVLVRLWSIREEFRRSYAALLDCLALTRRPVLVLTVYNITHAFTDIASMPRTSKPLKARCPSSMTSYSRRRAVAHSTSSSFGRCSTTGPTMPTQ